MAKQRKAPVQQVQGVPQKPKPLTPTQGTLLVALESSAQTIVTGPAGTGKTYLPSALAAYMLQRKDIRKIVLTRPNVPGGHSIGFFPGTLDEKMEPWLAPFLSVLRETLGEGPFEYHRKRGNIEIVPFEVMRGRTFDNAFVILDEAQNTTPKEMRMFVTRIGKWSKTVINGDLKQSDIKGENGLDWALRMVEKHALPVSTINFTIDDIVRSDECGAWLRAMAAEYE